MPWQALFQEKAVGFRLFQHACPFIQPYDDFPLFFVPSVSLFSVKAHNTERIQRRKKRPQAGDPVGHKRD
jgi:hypothetical protein